MAILKSIPSQRIINGHIVNSSEVSVVTDNEYISNGESCIILKGNIESKLILNSKTTDHVVVKAMTKVLVIPEVGKIDEEYDEILLDKGACVEFRFCIGSWYILSSDGLKQG